MKRNYLMASMLAAAAMFTGCSEVDDFFTPNTSKTYEASVEASLESVQGIESNEQLSTRAMFIGGNDGNRFANVWDEGDKVLVYQGTTKVGSWSLDDDANKEYQGTKDAYLSGTLTGTFEVGDQVTLYVTKDDNCVLRDYTGQDGTIGKLSRNYTYRNRTVSITDITGTKIQLDKANMYHSQAYNRYFLTDQEGNRLHIQQLIVSATGDNGIITSVADDGTETYGDLVVNTQLNRGEYPGEIYVAILNQGYTVNPETGQVTNGSVEAYQLTAIDDKGITWVFPGPEEHLGGTGEQKALNVKPTPGNLANIQRKMTKVEPTVELGTQMKMVVGTKRTRVPVVKAGETVVPATCTYTSSNYAVASVNASTGEVMALSTGTATITVNIAPYGVSRTYTVTVTESPTEYVDLGLSVNWATMNVGATSETGAGTYFAWGEVDGYTDENDFGKTYFGWGTYKWCNGDNTTLTKYVPEDKASSHGYNGFYDDKSILDPEDDAAKQNWGGNWSMPTKENWEELNNEDNCTWTWYDSGNTEFNGIPGYKITSKKAGYTDKYIFLPAAGYRRLDSYNEDGLGYYWATSLNLNNANSPRYAWRMRTHSTNRVGDDSRNIGFNVRAVCPKTNITLAPQMKVLQGAKKTRTPKVTVGSTDVTKQCTFTYSSSNYGVARVSPTGEVTGVTPGTATITVTSAAPYAATKTYTVTVTEPVAETADNYVDLGLPSGAKWAKMNVGATSETGAGTYFAFGEIDGYTDANDYTKTNFHWTTYKWCNGSNTTITKYVPEDKALSNGYNNFYDNKTTLEPEDDAAKQNWGGNWSIPTEADWIELRDNCTWQWENGTGNVLNTGGVKGYKVSNGDAYIFLPAAGDWLHEALENVNTYGYYWTSSLNLNNESYPRYAYRMRFNNNAASGIRIGDDSRCLGFNVRAIIKTSN